MLKTFVMNLSPFQIITIKLKDRISTNKSFRFETISKVKKSNVKQARMTKIYKANNQNY